MFNKYIQFSQNNYFYANLLKAYQITQDKYPICDGGYIKIKNDNDTEKLNGLSRIHLEKDPGKTIHEFNFKF
ncbi:MAG: hypothetical protein K8R58_07600 [Bacteroidales bacterium]|nr:hypothetical protein [Bacteroidales bacterium]